MLPCGSSSTLSATLLTASWLVAPGVAAAGSASTLPVFRERIEPELAGGGVEMSVYMSTQPAHDISVCHRNIYVDELVLKRQLRRNEPVLIGFLIVENASSGLRIRYGKQRQRILVEVRLVGRRGVFSYVPINQLYILPGVLVASETS